MNQHILSIVHELMYSGKVWSCYDVVVCLMTHLGMSNTRQTRVLALTYIEEVLNQ